MKLDDDDDNDSNVMRCMQIVYELPQLVEHGINNARVMGFEFHFFHRFAHYYPYFIFFLRVSLTVQSGLYRIPPEK